MHFKQAIKTEIDKPPLKKEMSRLKNEKYFCFDDSLSVSFVFFVIGKNTVIKLIKIFFVRKKKKNLIKYNYKKNELQYIFKVFQSDIVHYTVH